MNNVSPAWKANPVIESNRMRAGSRGAGNGGPTQISALEVSPLDRVQIFAPHPDDEALAAGGLIQRTIAAGADLQIVFATNGEANPWPQRVYFRRWGVSRTEQIIWGAQRRKEARAAMATLGADPDGAQFLDLPDTGLAERADEPFAIDAVKDLLAHFQPTVLVIPSPRDRHSDHGALYVMVQKALTRLHHAPERELHYLIHTHESVEDYAVTGLKLTPAEVATKHAAITSHQTQMILSRRRFTAFAREIEAFEEPHAMPFIGPGGMPMGGRKALPGMRTPALSYS